MVSKARKAAAQASFQQGKGKNYFYNGDTSLCQRATSVADLGNGDSGYHVQDRYKFAEAGAPNAEVTMSRSTDVPTGFQYSMKFLTTTNSGTVAAGDLVYFSQIFEGQDLYAWKKGTSDALAVTVSFSVKATQTGTYIVSMYDNDNNRTCSQAYTINSSNTWEYKTVTFPPDTTGVFGRDENASLYVHWGLVAGTDWTSGTLATTWQSNVSANQFAGQVDAFDDDDDVFLITGIQMELGNTATEFQHETYAQNLKRCQRYFNKILVGTGSYKFGHLLSAGSSGGTYIRNETSYPVTMRSATQTNTQTGAGSSGSLVGVGAGHSTKTYVVWQMNVTAAGNYAYFSNGTLTNDCEL